MTEKEYNEAIEALFVKFPSFQKAGGSAYKPGLENIYEIDKALGSPSSRLRCVHIAGTNGKGSVSHMIASALMQLPKYYVTGMTNGRPTAENLKVGLYTSPHLVDFRERIKVNGEMVPKEWVYDFLQSNEELFEEKQASFFEITTAMAFSYFAEQKVDIAVIECGLGGRLDSTNIISPIVSIITNIGLDHCQYLGDTLEEIAAEKAGIIKRDTPIVIGESDGKGVKEVFENTAKSADSPIIFAEKLNKYNPFALSQGMERQTSDTKITAAHQTDNKSAVCPPYPAHFPAFTQQAGAGSFSFQINDLFANTASLKSLSSLATCIYSSVSLEAMDLKGDCQKKNIKTVSCAIALILKKLSEEASIDISEPMLSKVFYGIENAAHLTGLRGRWEIMRQEPLVICDIGHNAHGMKTLFPQVRRTALQHDKLYMIFGVMRDKDLTAEYEYLPKEAEYLYVNAQGNRALPASELAAKMAEAGFKGEAVEDSKNVAGIALNSDQSGNYKEDNNAASSIQNAVKIALAKSDRNDFIFIGGSSYVVAEALECF